MHNQRLADDVAGGHPRVQGTVGVLKDHLHLPPHHPHIAGGEAGQFLAVENHIAGGGPVQLEDAAAGGGLAAAAFPHQAQGFPAADKETHIVHRLDLGYRPLKDDAGGNREIHLEVLDLQQDVARLGRAVSPRPGFGHGGHTLILSPADFPQGCPRSIPWRPPRHCPRRFPRSAESQGPTGPVHPSASRPTNGLR